MFLEKVTWLSLDKMIPSRYILGNVFVTGSGIGYGLFLAQEVGSDGFLFS